MFREIIYFMAFCIVIGFIGAMIMDIFSHTESVVHYTMRMDWVFICKS